MAIELGGPGNQWRTVDTVRTCEYLNMASTLGYQCACQYYNTTARRCVLPGRFKWRLSIILQHAQTPAQGQCLEISQTTNPRPLNPKTLKPKPWKIWILNQKTLRICSIFCNLSYHIRQRDILNVNVWATHGVCGYCYCMSISIISIIILIIIININI